MQTLITGGAGFIGSALARALLAQGHRVRVLDNLSTGRRDNLAGLEVELVVGDVLEPRALDRAINRVDWVFHLAAMVSVPLSLSAPDRDLKVNIAGTQSVLDAARRARVRRLVYSSSAAVYGDNPNLPLDEDAAVAPLSPYGVSKYAGELYARMYARTFGIETVALRYFNVYGPRQDPASPYSGVLSRFLAAVGGGVAPTIFGDGLQSRDFIYVDDVAQANLRAAEAPAERAVGRAYNIGTGLPATLLEVIAALNHVAGRPTAPVHQEAREGDIRHSLANIARARADLGFQPDWNLERGLAQTFAWTQAIDGHGPQRASDARPA